MIITDVQSQFFLIAALCFVCCDSSVARFMLWRHCRYDFLVLLVPYVVASCHNVVSNILTFICLGHVFISRDDLIHSQLWRP